MKLPQSRDRSFRCVSVMGNRIHWNRNHRERRPRRTASDRVSSVDIAPTTDKTPLYAPTAWAIFYNAWFTRRRVVRGSRALPGYRSQRESWSIIRLIFLGLSLSSRYMQCDKAIWACVSSSRLTILPGSLRAGWRELIGETRSITQRVQIASFIGIRKQFAFCSPLNPLSLLLKRCVRR